MKFENCGKLDNFILLLVFLIIPGSPGFQKYHRELLSACFLYSSRFPVFPVYIINWLSFPGFPVLVGTDLETYHNCVRLQIIIFIPGVPGSRKHHRELISALFLYNSRFPGFPVYILNYIYFPGFPVYISTDLKRCAIFINI